MNNTELQSVAIFGAGHISRALMPILTKLPIRIYWIDDRAEQFEQYQGDTSQINIICDDFISGFADLPEETYCLVITYSHKMDFDICEKIISRNSVTYLGMIGSRIKGNKFRDRLLQKGYSLKRCQIVCIIFPIYEEEAPSTDLQSSAYLELPMAWA